MTFPKHETKRRLDAIKGMTDEEIASNAEFIRATAESALCLINQWDGIIVKCRKSAKRTAIFNKVTKDGEQE